MNLMPLYLEVLQSLDSAFRVIETRIARPDLRQHAGERVYRYPSDSLEGAIVQKLARVISGLYACVVLVEHGLVQELQAMQRMLDEFTEDIYFLSHPLVGGERTSLHDEYLRYFYQEEVDERRKRSAYEVGRSSSARPLYRCIACDRAAVAELERTPSTWKSAFRCYTAPSGCLRRIGATLCDL